MPASLGGSPVRLSHNFINRRGNPAAVGEMRRLVAAIVLVTIFLAACSTGSLEGRLREQEGVRLFLAMGGGDATYAQARVGGSQALADLVASECPQAGDDAVRATFTSRGATLIVYASGGGANVSCEIFRPSQAQPIAYRPREQAPSEGVALVVNGAEVPLARVEAQLGALPQGTTLNESAVALALTRVIDDELLAQQAAGVSVNESEIAQARAAILSQAGVSEDTLAGLLAQQNVTGAQFDESVRAQARLGKLLTQRLRLGELSVDNETAQQYYLAHPNEFLESERADVRHLFVSAQGRSAQQVQERAQEIAGKLNTTDFCTLVRQYSDDPQARDTCGEITLSRGAIDPTIESAAFSTPPNATAMVVTASGVHFVQTLQVLPAQVVPYPQASQVLRTAIANSLLEQRLNLYLSMLRADANITVYLG